MPYKENLENVFKLRRDTAPPRYIFLDDAHETPWSNEMWQRVVDTLPRVSVILFSRYRHVVLAENENLTNRPLPIVEIEGRRLVRHGTSSCGLYFSQEEFDDLLGRMQPTSCLDDDLAEFVFKVTGGHVGTIKSIVEFIHKCVRTICGCD